MSGVDKAYNDCLEAKIKAAERLMMENVNRCLFPVMEGPIPYVPPPSRVVRFRRCAARLWLSAREWFAVHVLKVELARYEDEYDA